MRTAFKLTGFDGLSRDLARIGKQIATAKRAAVRPATARLRKAITAEAPVDSGDLVRSITSEVKGSTGEVRASAAHARLLEFGGRHTRPQPYFLVTAQRLAASLRSDMEKALDKAARL